MESTGQGTGIASLTSPWEAFFLSFLPLVSIQVLNTIPIAAQVLSPSYAIDHSTIAAANDSSRNGTGSYNLSFILGKTEVKSYEIRGSDHNDSLLRIKWDVDGTSPSRALFNP